MLTALVLTALTIVQDPPTFREIERLKFDALNRIENGRFTWQGTMQGGEEPPVQMLVEVKVKGEKLWSQVTADGVRNMLLLNTAESTMIVWFKDMAYGIFHFTERMPRAEQEYKEPTFEQGSDFNIDQFGPAIALGTLTQAMFVRKGTVTRDGEELDWYEHDIQSEKARSTVIQWFRKGTWLIKKMTVRGESDERGTMEIEVDTILLDTDAVIDDAELTIDPSVYAGMRKMRDPNAAKRLEREPREGLPDAPSYEEIEKLKIEAMIALPSGKFHYDLTLVDDRGASRIEARYVFRGDSERLTAWANGTRSLDSQSVGGQWLSVSPELLSMTTDRPKDFRLRLEMATVETNKTKLITYNTTGVHILTGYVTGSLFLDYGEQTVDGIECVWFEHKVNTPFVVAIIKQWFKKGTWLTYMAEVDSIHTVQGELNIKLRMMQFEPDAEVTDGDLIIDPALYMGYRTTSEDNPTGLGRTAIERDVPSYHEIDQLKFQALIGLDSGKFTFNSLSMSQGQRPTVGDVQFVFRGDEYRVYTEENGEKVSDTAMVGSTHINVFHKLRSFMVGQQDEDQHSKDKEFKRPVVDARSMKFRSYSTGVYVHLNEKEAPKLVAAGEEIVGDTSCQWYEHELTNTGGGIIVRQWFQKGTWLLVKLEAREIVGHVMVSTISVRATVFEPNADVTDEDLAVDPARYEGYTKVDPPRR